MVVFTASEVHHQGSAVMSPMSSSSHKVKRSVSASEAGEVFMMSEGLAQCEWINGVLESAVYHDYDPSLHQRKSITLPVEPTVTVMEADSHLQVAPSTLCVIVAKSAFDHLVREPTGGHCRRTAQELCVIRRSMQTLRARCRWVPHERMVVDALTKSHGNSVTMLQLLRDGVLSIVDETGSWRIAKRTGRSTNVTYDHIDNWSQPKTWNGTDEMQWDALIRSKQMRSCASDKVRCPLAHQSSAHGLVV